MINLPFMGKTEKEHWENIYRFADVLHYQGSSDFVTGLIEKHEKNGLDAQSAFEIKLKQVHKWILFN